jgi:chromosomal replication initiator protein
MKFEQLNESQRERMESKSAQEIWEAALGELQIQVSKQNYRTWLEKTTGLSYHDSQFVVGVPNTFAAEYLDKKQRSLIEKTLIGLTASEVEVIFQVDNCHQNSPPGHSVGEKTIPASRAIFNPKYTFSSFIIGNCNQLAHAAALGVAENPGHSYNPLFIYGGVGLGKTHLLHAIGHVALAKHLKVLYVSAERFTNEFITAVYERKTENFHNKYRSVDILLIDDIQFICGKEQTEESFFHTFNELHNTNRQIAITSDLPPKSLPLRQRRLRSRFEGGLIVAVEPPELDTRLAILQTKAEQQGVTIPLDALKLIAQQAEQNIRDLEGLLNRVIAYARLVRATVTPELAARAIVDIASTTPRGADITPGWVIEAVASSFQLTPADLKTRKRDKATALARQVAMYLIRQETSFSLGQIGNELGGRDHSTVIHACDKIVHEINTSPYLRRKIADIQHIIHSKQSAVD